MSQNTNAPGSWGDFIINANKALKASQPVTHRRFISLMLEPHFHNHVLLNLQWAEDGIKWYRSVWLKHEDAPKFIHPIEQLKYIGKTIEPALTLETGILNPQETETLLNLLHNFHINPYIDNDGRIVLDGCIHTLTFGTDYSTRSSFQWNYLPEEYSELQKLSDLLEVLCTKH